MKFLFVGFLLLSLNTSAIEPKQLESMLSEAAVAQTNSYIEARNEIVDLGTNAVPLLALAATDTRLNWQQHLVARICYERITRQDDIKSLLNHDWHSYPPYSGIPPPGHKYGSVAGPHSEMGPLVTFPRGLEQIQSESRSVFDCIVITLISSFKELSIAAQEGVPQPERAAVGNSVRANSIGVRWPSALCGRSVL